MVGRAREKNLSKLIKSGSKYAAIGGGLVIAALLVAYALHSRCHRASYPQGGMWLPEQIPQHADALKKMGLDIPAASLAKPDEAPLSASVSLGGCSASFISPRGLIATNHHCVVGILNNLGKDGNDYQTNGFLAQSMKDEKPAPPTQKVYVTVAYEDVTETIREGLDVIPDASVRSDTVDRRIDEVIRARETVEKAKDPSMQVEVKSYYRDSRFILWLKKEIRDVRLVYAPHSGIGNFGGDVDNWHWPRHTGDFSLLRAYVSKTGASTPYSPDNVPYESKNYLKLPSEPLDTGDLVFVMGYPGATERWETAEEVKKEIDVHYPHMIARSRGFISVLEKFEKSDNPQSARVAKGMLPRLRNYLPLWEGELEGMKKFGVLQEKEHEQAKIVAWVEQKPERKERFPTVVKPLEEGEGVAKPAKDAKEVDRLKDRSLKEFVSWGFGSRPPAGLFRASLLVTRMADARTKKDADRRIDLKQRDWENLRISIGQTYQDQIDVEVEKSIVAYFLELARQAGNEQLLEAVTGQKNPFEKDVRARLDEIFAKTKMLDLNTRLALFDSATPQQLAASTDPALVVAQKLAEQWKKMEERADEERGKELIEMAQWAEARLQYLGTPQAPDANASLRITFGTVCNYCPGFLKTPYPTFTYASQVVAKDTGQAPFNTPPKALEAIRNKDFGPYADNTGDLPVAFISDLDITGGNSGSPVLNRRGELVGLAFDGVVEAMASDKKYLPDLSRTIAVDTRYFLWTLDKVESAKWILAELDPKPGPKLDQGSAEETLSK